jgi:hypothetical protein
VDSPGGPPCPTDWRDTNNMLDCVGCCLRSSQVFSVVETGVECYAVARPLKPVRPSGSINVIGNSVKRWQFSWKMNSTEHCMTKTLVECGIKKETISCLNRWCMYYVIVDGAIDWARIGLCFEACDRKFGNPSLGMPRQPGDGVH